MPRMSVYLIPAIFICVVANAQITWNPLTVPSGGADFSAVHFVNGRVGLIVGADVMSGGAIMLRTTDGGVTWTEPLLGPHPGLTELSFANNSVGIAVGGSGEILFTQDAGVTWSYILADEMGLSMLFAAHMVSPTIGVAMGMDGLGRPFGVRTVDGWQSHNGFSFSVEHEGIGYSGSVSGVYFFDANVGVASTTLSGGYGAIVKTTDGGQSWITKCWAADGGFRRLAFATSTTGYVCGGGGRGAFTKTTDAGETWTTLNTGYDYYLDGVTFLNPDTGWVVGEDGIILRTNNGGQTFCQQIDATYRFDDVCFADADTGYAVGIWDTALKTTHGGEILNSQPPGEFTRLAPHDDSTYWYGEPGPVTFRWTTAGDPDGDSVVYHLDVGVWGQHFSFVTGDTVFSDSLEGAWADPYMPVTWRVVATDGLNFTNALNGDGHFTILLPDEADGPSSALPSKFAVMAYPNPFNSATTLTLSLPQPGDVRLMVFNIQGQRVVDRPFGVLAAGEHRVEFDGSQLPSGIYVSRVEASHGTVSKKLVLLK